MAVDTTEPLKNGDSLPDHPSDTNSKRIIRFLTVRDAFDGKACSGGLHESIVRLLMSGEPVLQHQYKFRMAAGKIYHTRKLVTIDVECEEE